MSENPLLRPGPQREAHGWTQARVGCHWIRGPYTASTEQIGDRVGYGLWFNRDQIAQFLTWDEVERLADRRNP
jgi:hypothetical protein